MGRRLTVLSRNHFSSQIDAHKLSTRDCDSPHDRFSPFRSLGTGQPPAAPSHDVPSYNPFHSFLVLPSTRQRSGLFVIYRRTAEHQRRRSLSSKPRTLRAPRRLQSEVFPLVAPFAYHVVKVDRFRADLLVLRRHLVTRRPDTSESIAPKVRRTQNSTTLEVYVPHRPRGSAIRGVSPSVVNARVASPPSTTPTLPPTEQ